MVGNITHEGWRDLFAQLANAAPAEYAVKVLLYTGLAHPVGYNTTFADLTEATFVGYARVAKAKFDSAGTDSSGRAGLFLISLSFTAGAIVGTQTVQGIAVCNTTPNKLLALADFGVPVTFAYNGDLLNSTLELRDDGSLQGDFTFISAGP